MNVRCEKCETTYRIDPRKVPPAGIKARCSRCAAIIHVVGQQASPEAVPAEASAPAAAPERAPETPARPPAIASDPGAATRTAEAAETAAPPSPQRPPPVFGSNDPHARAKRLARALVSDIAVYHPERRDRSLAAGSLRQEFRDEIKKSWEEYASQVGDETARATPYFREALNEILAKGQAVF